MKICIYTYKYTQSYTSTYIYLCIHTHIYIYIYTYMYIYTHTCICTYFVTFLVTHHEHSCFSQHSSKLTNTDLTLKGTSVSGCELHTCVCVSMRG